MTSKMTSKERPAEYLLMLWVTRDGVEKVTFPGSDHPNVRGYACYTAVFPLIQRLSRAVVRWSESHYASTSKE